jgi:hypothetical protein
MPYENLILNATFFWKDYTPIGTYGSPDDSFKVAERKYPHQNKSCQLGVFGRARKGQFYK